MKKILALVLVLVLAIGLCACGSTGTASTGGSSSGGSTASSGGSTTSGGAKVSEAAKEILEAEKTDKPYPNCNEDGSINLDKIANFDEEYNYAAGPSYKICYLASSGTVLYEQSAVAIEHWCPLYNMEWLGFQSSNGDSDLFMTMLQTMLDQGCQGFILDPDSTIFPTVKKLMDQYPDRFWCSLMSPARDGTSGDGVPVGGNMINNYSGFDNVDAGYKVGSRPLKWIKDTYPNADWNEVGFLMFDYSVSPALHERTIGSKNAFLEYGGKEENFFIADCVSTGLTNQGGLDAAGPVVASHPEIKYWACNGLIDDLAQAAASIFDTQGLTDTSAVCVFGGSALIQQWDGGQQDAFRFAVYCGQSLMAEPLVGALYAYLNGWATPDSIWPSWVKWNDHGGEGHTYSNLRLPVESLEYENYKHYLEWTDLYTHSDIFNYDEKVELSDFSPFVEVPADFKAP